MEISGGWKILELIASYIMHYIANIYLSVSYSKLIHVDNGPLWINWTGVIALYFYWFQHSLT